MFNPLLDDIKAAVKAPFMVIAGGSRVAQNGQFMDAQSDYDLIVLSQDETQPPISYNNFRGQADIVVRTPDSLAFEVLQAANSRNGAVLDMIANGSVIYDPLKLGSAYQASFQQIYQQGPWPITSWDLQQTHDHLTYQALFLASKQDKTIATTAAAYWLAHETAQYHLDAENGWHKSGKMVARYLHTKHPAEHHAQVALFTDHTTGIVLPSPPERDLQVLTPPEHAYLRVVGSVFDYHDPNYIAFASRQNPHIEKEFMHDDDAFIARAAKDGFRYRWTSILGNIKPLRYHHASYEYHYALGKAVKSLVIYNSATESHKQNIGQITMMVEDHPKIFDHFPAATQGKPEAFKEAVAGTLLDHHGGLWPCDKIFLRKSPHGHRLDGFTAENFPQKIKKTLAL